MAPETEEEMKQLLQKYTTALKAFSNSNSKFQILHSVGRPPTSSPQHAEKQQLYILDSSFNPPTLAHQHIAQSALSSHASNNASAENSQARLLLLLATQNADKAPKPASFPQRLTMMTLFAHTLLQPPPSIPNTKPAPPDLGIDIAVTSEPYFHLKSAAISSSSSYSPACSQVHLTGYDTLIRLLDPKYYPPTHSLSVLQDFLGAHRVWVTYRAGDSWGERKEQDEFLERIARGEMDGIGAKREWVSEGRIKLVEGREGEVVSSSRVRDAVKRGDEEELGRLVPGSIKEWILSERLYREE
ncbi:hypothetical protein BP6252_12167 [Coleophoma cylindrospora]|uniref:Nicotinamide-nucleotide adenylyltransferase n=1 Tax=Coleophoma cylindrospora TaxID=1849047 RepID=A0A3D8QH85_9HELO|nr:hypothetical protein BP6252_12167 [Coleophoma cylindrospora]